MRISLAAFLILAIACHKAAKEPPSGAPRNAMQSMRVGSAPFHVEIAGVYERFQDPKAAAEHFTDALEAAQNGMERVQALSGLARVKLAAGDKDSAISWLEQAMAELEKLKAGAATGPAGGMPFGDEVVEQLARLHVERRSYERAEGLYKAELAAASGPFRREMAYRNLAEVYRQAGTLDAKVADKEKAVEKDPQDEDALRFLAAAYGGSPTAAPPLPGGQPSNAQPDFEKQARVYEQLHRLHPDDAQVRRTLQALLERSGRIDDAVKLVADVAPVANPSECLGGVGPLPVSGALGAAAEVVRIRFRAGQRDVALAETAKLAAPGARDGVAANLVAVQLFLEQNKPDRAELVVKQASQRARSREDQRKLALAREQVVSRSGQPADLKALHAEWATSADPCLRSLAAERERNAMAVAAPADSSLPSDH